MSNGIGGYLTPEQDDRLYAASTLGLVLLTTATESELSPELQKELAQVFVEIGKVMVEVTTEEKAKQDAEKARVYPSDPDEAPAAVVPDGES